MRAADTRPSAWPRLALWGGVGAAAFMMNPLLSLKVAGAAAVGGAVNYAMARLWTSPTFVNWATGYTKALASGKPEATKAQIGRLAKITAKNPELREMIQTLVRSSANDNAATPLAAEGSVDDQQQ